MPVSPFTYMYLTFTITNLILCVMSAVKQNEEKFAVFVLSTMLMLIGFLSNRYAIQAV